jgi:hypothetical protein
MVKSTLKGYGGMIINKLHRLEIIEERGLAVELW